MGCGASTSNPSDSSTDPESRRAAQKKNTTSLFNSKSFIEGYEKNSSNKRFNNEGNSGIEVMFKKMNKRDVKDCMQFMNEKKCKKERISEIKQLDLTFLKIALD